jgi:AraC-like DNA-binding protein
VAILKGNGFYVGEDGTELTLLPGDVIIIHPDTACNYSAETQWESCWIDWAGPLADSLTLQGYFPRVPPILRGAADIVSDAFSKLEPLMQENDRTSALRRMVLVQQLITDLFEFTQRGRDQTLNVQKMADVCAYLDSHLGETIPIGEVAREFSMSLTHFRRVFKEIMGCTPKAYVQNKRINEAKHLLSRGVAMKEVAGNVGYSDLFHFMRSFKRLTGMPPGQFVKQLDR